MAKFLIFSEDYSYDIDDRSRHNIPAGWSGEVDDAVAEDAMEQGKASEPDAPVIDATAKSSKGKASEPASDAAP